MVSRQNTLSASLWLLVLLLLIYDSEGTCGCPRRRPFLHVAGGYGNRISNGIEAKRHSHPWQALIFTTVGDEYNTCGGSLVHWKEGNASDVVLTAAHCVIDVSRFVTPTAWEQFTYNFKSLFDKSVKNGPVVNVSNVTVYLGVHDAERDISWSRPLGVKEIAVGEFNQVNQVDDIAILRLEKEVTYNALVQGICLPPPDEKSVPQEAPCLVTGWGLMADGIPATKLQQVDAQVFEHRVKYKLFRPDRMICIRGKSNSSGPAHGDSGGPLSCLRNNSYVLYGVVSFGMRGGCYEKNRVHVFMKIPYYMNWLYRTMTRMHAPQ